MRLRVVSVGGLLVVVALAVWLGISLGSSTTPTTTTTTTTSTTTIAQGNGSFRSQIDTSLRDTKAVAATFLRSFGACKTIDCYQSAANTALNAEGTISNLVHQNEFPANASFAGTSYVEVLQSLQKTYLTASSSNAGLLQVPSAVKTALTDAAKAARVVDALLK
jgi:hypothetical protein